jgi:hypothetical protein
MQVAVRIRDLTRVTRILYVSSIIQNCGMTPGRIAAPGFLQRGSNARMVDRVIRFSGGRVPRAVHFGETNPRCKNATVTDRSSRGHVTADRLLDRSARHAIAFLRMASPLYPRQLAGES